MYQLTATGGQSDTLVITDLSTGAVVKNPALTAVDVRFRSGHPILATGTVEVIRPDLEVSSFDWLTRHPITDKLTALAALEFRDGARIEFQDNGAPVVMPAASAHEPPPASPRSEAATDGRRPPVIAIYGERGTGKTRTLTAIVRALLAEGHTLAILKGRSDSYSTSQDMGLEDAKRVLWFGGFSAAQVAQSSGFTFDTLLVDEAGVFTHDEFQALVAWAQSSGATKVFAVNPPQKNETVTVTLKFEAPDLLHSVAKALFGDDVPAPPADLTTLEMSEVIAFQLRRRATNAGASLNDFWSVLRPDGIGSHAAPKGMVWVGDLGPEMVRPVGGPMGITPDGGIARNYGAFADGLIPGELGELPPSNLIKVASVLIEPALDGAFNVQGSDPLVGEFRTDLERALDVAVRWLAAGEMVPDFETAGVRIGERLSVIIERYQDPDGKDCYAASTSAGADGYAHGISAVTSRPDWTSEESLAGVLDFARQHLAPAPGESGEVVAATVTA